ncbi:MAG: penicillin acylase family protein [Chlamydiales bacterium]|nr:penicillin acylase family protein [Chlamydiales bacterium]
MELFSKVRTYHIGDRIVEIGRNSHGVVEIRSQDPVSIQCGIGYAHAHDRLMQLIILHTLAQGRICEFFIDSQEAFAFDVLIRKLGFRNDIENDLSNLSGETVQWIEAYCEGINSYVERHGSPLICKLLKIKLHPWKVSDVMLIVKLHMYLGLAQIQERTERFIIQAVHDGVSVEKLKELFRPHLETLDSKLIALIKECRLDRPYLDEQMEFMPGMSNNWALAPSKTSTGSAFLCDDPHLQINRLPSIWYEVATYVGEEKHFGATSPGFPGIVIGRSNNLSVGVTYGMMDTIDFFIEKVHEGQVMRPEGSMRAKAREEVIQRKKEGEARLYFYESDAGVIERQFAQHKRIEEGYYLALNWSGKIKGASPTLNAMSKLWRCSSVQEAQKVLREATFSFNWVLADHEGNIGFQQSGRLPNRNHSGLHPLPAWVKGALWEGFVPAEKLTSEYNPERGFVASANDDKNSPDGPLSINLPYASYRYDRIYQTLSRNKKFTIEGMKALQSDLYSLQAELFTEQIRSLIPETPLGKILKEWDFRYDKESKGAVLFEAFYLDLILEVFGKVFGMKTWDNIVRRHSLLVFIHGHFDRILLTGDESWFGEEGKERLFRRLLEKNLDRFSSELPSWGKKNQLILDHMLFEGKFSKIFGKGPYPAEGGRASVCAYIPFREHKRRIAAGASYRFIADMGTEEAFTVLCGGPTEGRFSKYYVSDLPMWLNFEYKKLK